MKDPFSGYYDTIFEPLYTGLKAIGLKIFRHPGMKALDIGCGTDCRRIREFLTDGMELAT